MSIYHFSVNIQSRTLGSSPLATLAYQLRTSVYDSVNKKTFSYKGSDFGFSGVCLPKNAPEKYSDPITLWTDVLLNETQVNAQLCRRFNCSLPNELSDIENRKIIESFAEYMAEQGMCVTYAYHNKKGNKHVHFQTTCRGLDSKGNWERIKTKKDYKLDAKGNRIPVLLDDQGKKIPLNEILDSNGVVRTDLDLSKQKKGTRNALIWERIAVKSESGKSLQWDSKNTFESWRAKWADVCNEQLKESGIKSRIDHRSLERQELETQLSTKELNALSTQSKIELLEDKLSALFKEKNELVNSQQQLSYSYNLDKEFSYDRYDIENYDHQKYQPVEFYIGATTSKRKISDRELLLSQVPTCNVADIKWRECVSYMPLHVTKNKILQQSGQKVSNSEVVFVNRISELRRKVTTDFNYSIPTLIFEKNNVVKEIHTTDNLGIYDKVNTKSFDYKKPSILQKLTLKLSEFSSLCKHHIAKLFTKKRSIEKLCNTNVQGIKEIKPYELSEKNKNNNMQNHNYLKNYENTQLAENISFDSVLFETDFENEPDFLIGTDFYSVMDIDDMVRNHEISIEDLKTTLLEARKDYWSIYKSKTSIDEIKKIDTPSKNNEKEKTHVRGV